MSDLYLIQRHRLEDITDWVMIDTDVLRTARSRVGLSYEAVARHLHVSSKTYERYEKRGRIPRGLVTTVASLLELQIEAALPPPPRVADTWTIDTPGEERLREIVREEIAAALAPIIDRLDDNPLPRQNAA